MEAADLTGKFILLYSEGVDLHHPTSMEISRVEEISGKIFLVGTQPVDLLGRDNWLGKTETFVAWNSITQFHIFDDYDAFKTVLPEEKTAGLFGLFKG